MNDFDRDIERLGELVDVEWTDARAKRVERALLARRERRAKTRVIGIGFALASAAALAVVVQRRAVDTHGAPIAATSAAAPATAPAPPTAPPEHVGRVELPGGGFATLLDPASNVTVAADRVDVHGGARLVSPRAIHVHVAAFLIDVPAGGEVVVAESTGGVRVSAVHGRARATWSAGGARDIDEGETADLVATTAPEGAGSAAPPRTKAASAAKEASGEAPWKTLAGAGDYDRAYEALREGGGQRVADVPNDLLLAADVARLSHHPAQAVAPLESIVRDHAGDARAPLAAFTLGRVLLEELARPGDAADAFAKARALAPSGSLAEDALAREVEAAARAGDAARARQRADEYLERYPQGSRAATVRRYASAP